MERVILYGHYTGGENTQGGKVVSVNGIAPCVTENHGMVTAILEEKDEQVSSVRNVGRKV